MDGNDNGKTKDLQMTDEQAELEEAMKSIEEAHGATTANNKQVAVGTTDKDDANTDADQGEGTGGDKKDKSGKEKAMEWFQTIGLSNSLRDIGLGDSTSNIDKQCETETSPTDGEAGVAKAAAGYFASVSSYFTGGRSSASKTTTDDNSHNNSSSAIPKFSLSGGASVVSMMSHDSQGDPEVLHIQNEIKLVKTKLKELKESNRQIVKKHRGDLSSWQQRKASKGREIWMKRQYASNFGLGMYKDILMDCSEACDEHDSSPKTLTAEASLLRAHHNEKMTEKLMTMVHTNQQELIDHFYTELLPQMKEERDQVRPDGERKVEEARKVVEELRELFEKVVDLQTTIIQKYRENLPEEEKTIEECDEFAEDTEEDEQEGQNTDDDKTMKEKVGNDEECEEEEDEELVERGRKKGGKVLAESSVVVDDAATAEKVEEEDRVSVDGGDVNLPNEGDVLDQSNDVATDEAAPDETEDNQDTEMSAGSTDDGGADGEEKTSGNSTRSTTRAARPGGVSSSLSRPTAASTASSRMNTNRRPIASAVGTGSGAAAARSRPTATVTSAATSRPLPSRTVNGAATRAGAGAGASSTGSLNKSSGLTAEQRAKIRSELRAGSKT